MTPDELFDKWYGPTGRVGITKNNARCIWDAALANTPQPQWRRWEDEKPQVENKDGADSVILEGSSKGIYDFAYVLISQALNPNWIVNFEPVAWFYLTPSGFAPKQKDEASIAFQEWVKKKCEGVTMIPDPTVKESRVGNVTEDVFTEIYNLGRAKAKQ